MTIATTDVHALTGTAGQPEVVTALTSSVPRPRPTSRGRTLSLTTSGPAGLDYFVYLPTKPTQPERVVVSVHGYTRNAAEHALCLAPIAEELGIALVVPHFTRRRFRRFQQLKPDANGVTPDGALDEVLADTARRFGVNVAAVSMFGFSGGGQFLHRYMLVRPGRVVSAALFAPGWFTWPDDSQPFPFGTGDSEELGARQLSLGGLFGARMRVYVGDRDIKRGGAFNKDERLDHQQGRTRLERARRWVAAMEEAAPGDTAIELTVLENVGHDFRRNVVDRGAGRRILAWLAGLPQN